MARKKVQLVDKDNNTIYPITVGTSLEAIVDLLYPVGTYISTSNTSFDPNTSLGGTWVKDVTGRVLVAKDSGTFSTVGSTGGVENKPRLTKNNFPEGKFSIYHIDNNDLTSAYHAAGMVTHTWNNSNPNSNGKGQGAEDAAATNKMAWDYYFGKSTPDQITNMAAYIVVIYWHRIA